MSVSYHASIMVGFMFSKPDIMRKSIRRGCAHPEIQGAKFCPECGKVMFVNHQEQLIYDGDNVVQPYVCMHGNSNGRYNVDDYYVIGTMAPSFIRAVKAEGMLATEVELTAKLTALGLDVSKGTFGIHLVSYFG